MQITKLEDGAAAPKPDTKVFTQEELQKEFDFILAERIVRKMAEKGLISDDELLYILIFRIFSSFCLYISLAKLFAIKTLSTEIETICLSSSILFC